MKKRLLALIVCLCLSVSAFGLGASAAPTEIHPTWFKSTDGWMTWWWDDTLFSDWYSTVVLDSNSWTFTLRDTDAAGSVVGTSADWGGDATTVRYYGSDCFCLDFDEVPYLNLKVKTTAESSVFKMRFYQISDETGNTFGDEVVIDVATVLRGDNTVSVDLRENAQLKSFANSKNQVYCSGLWFSTESGKFQRGNYLSVEDVALSSTPSVSSLYPNWYAQSNDSSWWNWDWQYGSSPDNMRFTLERPEGALLKLSTRWNSLTRFDCNAPGTNISIDDYNTLTYNISCSKPTQLVAQVYRITNGSPDGSTRSFIPVLSLPAGDNKGALDLRTVPAFMDMVNSDGMIHTSGIGFNISGDVGGDSITVYDIRFTAPLVSQTANVTAANEVIVRPENGGNAVFEANVTVSDSTLKPAYQWYVDGEAVENATSESFETDNSVIGKHSVYCVASLSYGTGIMKKTVTTKSQTAEFGVFIPGDVTFTGEVVAEDLVALRQNIIGSADFGAVENAAADVTGDGNVDITDLIRLKKYHVDPDNTVLGSTEK